MDYESFLSEWRNSKKSIKVSTSGSTGKPKDIYLSKDFIRESAIRSNKFFNINSYSRLHSCISPDFIGGKMMAVRAAVSQAAFTWENPSNCPLQNLSSREVISLLAVVPSQMDYLLTHKKDLPSIKNIIVGGAPISPSSRERIAHSGLNVFETYGMTETASHIALRKITEEEKPFETIGGISVSLSDNECLCIEFPGGQRIQTNDIAEIISSSKFHILGRYDNVIITGARKVNPEMLEKAISHIIQQPFFITSLPDEKWGEKIVLIIEREVAESNAGSRDISQLIRLFLPSWQVPKEIFFISELPKTANGKIKRIKGTQLENYLSNLS